MRAPVIEPKRNSPSVNSHSMPDTRGDPSARIVAMVLWRPASNSCRTRAANSGSACSIACQPGTAVTVLRPVQRARWCCPWRRVIQAWAPFPCEATRARPSPHDRPYVPPHPVEPHVRWAVIGRLVIVLVLGWAATDRDRRRAACDHTEHDDGVARHRSTGRRRCPPRPLIRVLRWASTCAPPAASASADDAGSDIAALELIVDEMRADATMAPPDVRAASEQIVQLYAILLEPGRDAIAAAATADDKVIGPLVDEMVQLTHQMFLHPGASPGWSSSTQLARAWSTSSRPDRPVPPRTRPSACAPSVSASTSSVPGDLATDYLPPAVLDLTDRDMTAPCPGSRTSTRTAAADLDALTPGDNEGCDALHEACDQRDLLACNDLYWSSVVGSEYETFGATCGGRTEFGRAGFGGFCEELE